MVARLVGMKTSLLVAGAADKRDLTSPVATQSEVVVAGSRFGYCSDNLVSSHDFVQKMISGYIGPGRHTVHLGHIAKSRL